MALPSSTTTDTYPLSLHDALPIFSIHSIVFDCSGTAAGMTMPARPATFTRASQVGPSTRRVIARSAAARAMSLRVDRSEEHTSELQSRRDLVCRLLLDRKDRCR